MRDEKVDVQCGRYLYQSKSGTVSGSRLWHLLAGGQPRACLGDGGGSHDGDATVDDPTGPPVTDEGGDRDGDGQESVTDSLEKCENGKKSTEIGGRYIPKHIGMRAKVRVFLTLKNA